MPQVRSIADVKNHLLRPATTNNFEVEIPFNTVLNSQLDTLLKDEVLNDAGVYLNTNDSWKLRLLCSSASLPGSNLATTDVLNDRTGVREQHVHRRLYDDQGIDFTFYVNADNYIPIRTFETWMDYASGVSTQEQREDTKNPNYFYRMRYPDEYIADSGLKITKFEKDWSTAERALGGVLEYEFIRTFPTAISSMPVTYDTANLLEVTVTFSYVRYVMNKGWMQTSNRDPLKMYAGITKEILSGDLRGAWEVLTNGGVPSQVANAAGNALRSIVTFAFGEGGMDKARGGARWVSNTMSWLGSFGR